MMDGFKWFKLGILILIAALPLAATGWTDQSSSASGISLSITTIKKWLWKAGELATIGHKDDSAVLQYTWTVKNIEDKITKANHTRDKILSPPFYTDVPGYIFRLALFLYDRNTSYMGVYLDPIKGQFDDLVPWPFDSRFELSSAGSDGNTFASVSRDPSTDCNGMFYRPPYKNVGCGKGRYFDIETLMSNKTAYLIDGALNINVTIYLEE